MSLLGGLFGNSPDDKSAPIVLSFKSAQGGTSLSSLASASPAPSGLAGALVGLLSGGSSIKLFDSYSFERNMLAPGAPFRFTAPGLDKETRMSIRSGDTVQLLAIDRNGNQIPVATGFIDETDTHISPGRVEYVLTGRDTLGQLIDNAAVDNKNKIININNQTIEVILKQLVSNTRIPQGIVTQQLDTGPLLFQTNVSETKMNALQRYLEITNCLVWTLPNGQVKLGKPNFMATPAHGTLSVGTSGESSAFSIPSFPTVPQTTNILDCRVKRNVNNAIRQMVTQMQNLNQVDASAYTINNQDQDVKKVAGQGVGRSVYRVFSFGEGATPVNVLFHVPNIPGLPNQIGAGYTYREIARENVHVLEVEVTVQGHFNSRGNLYDVDQVYYCNIPDEDISDNMYCYAVTHELTLDHGMITKLRLCRMGTIVAGSYQIPSLSSLL